MPSFRPHKTRPACPRDITVFHLSPSAGFIYVSICFAGNHEDENDHRMTAEGHTDIHVSSSYQTWECKQQPLMRWLIVHLNRILNAAQFSFFQLSLIYNKFSFSFTHAIIFVVPVPVSLPGICGLYWLFPNKTKRKMCAVDWWIISVGLVCTMWSGWVEWKRSLIRSRLSLYYVSWGDVNKWLGFFFFWWGVFLFCGRREKAETFVPKFYYSSSQKDSFTLRLRQQCAVTEYFFFCLFFFFRSCLLIYLHVHWRI